MKVKVENFKKKTNDRAGYHLHKENLGNSKESKGSEVYF